MVIGFMGHFSSSGELFVVLLRPTRVARGSAGGWNLNGRHFRHNFSATIPWHNPLAQSLCTILRHNPLA